MSAGRIKPINYTELSLELAKKHFQALMVDLTDEIAKVQREISDIAEKFQSVKNEVVLRKEKLYAIQASLQKYADIDGLVKLNVGGKKVEIGRATICKILADPEVDSESVSSVHRFASLLSGRWDRFLPKDRAGYIYQNRFRARLDPSFR